jgi:hypothetical protein
MSGFGVTIHDLPDDAVLHFSSFLDIPSISRMSACASDLRQYKDYTEGWVRSFNAKWPLERIGDAFDESSRLFCRDSLFKRAHVRTDGAYVSRCLYSRRIQEGASLTDSRTYLQIVYHRMIRFLPNGPALMLISEKGSRGSARQAFKDLVRSDSDPQRIEKYAKQLNRCKWRPCDETSEGLTIMLSYFDGKLCWSAKLQVCHGTSKRFSGTRITWLEYLFWDPAQVAERRRRDLYREKERISRMLRLISPANATAETLSDLLFQIDRLSDAIRCVREEHEDCADTIPEDLTRDLKLSPDHFPVARFGFASELAHFF